MKREPMVFAVAGMIFGFVLGYMAAGLGDRPGAAVGPRLGDARPPGLASGAPPAAAAPGATDRPAGPADPDEVRTLESLAAKDKTNVQARVELGNLYMDHAQYEEAARWYREALALKPDDNDVRVDLGASLVNLGRAADAIAEFDRALQKDPGHKKALFNKGLALMQSGRQKEAVAVWDGLLKRYPGDPQLQGLQEQIDRIRGGAATRGGPS
jgi:tetratricopeptide (TPR) repeat protein